MTAAESREKSRRTLYYAYLIAPLVYLLLMFLMIWRKIDIKIFEFDDYFYLSLIYPLAVIALIGWVKNRLWENSKRNIHSIEDFSAAYFTNNMRYIVLLESIGIIGLLIFFLTGNLPLPIGIIALCFLGLLINFPTKAEREQRMKQFHFDSMNT